MSSSPLTYLAPRTWAAMHALPRGNWAVFSGKSDQPEERQMIGQTSRVPQDKGLADRPRAKTTLILRARSHSASSPTSLQNEQTAKELQKKREYNFKKTKVI